MSSHTTMYNGTEKRKPCENANATPLCYLEESVSKQHEPEGKKTSEKG